MKISFCVALCVLMASAHAMVKVGNKSVQQINFENDNKKEPYKPPRSVQLSKNEVDKSNVCSSLWSKDSTICKGNKLVELFKEESKQISEELELVKKALDPKNANSFHMKDVMTIQQGKEAVDSMVKFWGVLKKARGAALCFMCSKNHKAYIRKERGIITQADCSKVVTPGIPFVKQLVDLIEHLQKSIDNHATSDKTKNSNWKEDKKQFVSSIENLKRHLAHAKVPELVSSYLRSSGNSQTDIAIQLCVRFIRLREDPIFGALTRFFKEMTGVEKAPKQNTPVNPSGNGSGSTHQKTAGESGKQSSANTGASKTKSTSSNNRSNRKLTTLAQTLQSDPFAGDVSVFKAGDNMFVSYDGSKGTTYEKDHGYKTMNLSMHFP